MIHTITLSIVPVIKPSSTTPTLIITITTTGIRKTDKISNQHVNIYIDDDDGNHFNIDDMYWWFNFKESLSSVMIIRTIM